MLQTSSDASSTGGWTTTDDCPDNHCDGPRGCDDDCPSFGDVITQCEAQGGLPYPETCGEFEHVFCSDDVGGYGWYFRDGQALCQVVSFDSQEYCDCTRYSYVLGDCQGAAGEC